MVLQQGKGGVMEFARNAIRQSHFSNSVLFLVLCAFSLWWLLLNFSNLELSFESIDRGRDMMDKKSKPQTTLLPSSVLTASAVDERLQVLESNRPNYTAFSASTAGTASSAAKLVVHEDNQTRSRSSGSASDVVEEHRISHGNIAPAVVEAAAAANRDRDHHLDRTTIFLRHRHQNYSRITTVDITDRNSTSTSTDSHLPPSNSTIKTDIRSSPISNKSTIDFAADSNSSSVNSSNRYSVVLMNSSSASASGGGQHSVVHESGLVVSRDDNATDGSAEGGDLKLLATVSPAESGAIVDQENGTNTSTASKFDYTIHSAAAADFCSDSSYWEEWSRCDVSKGEWVWDPEATTPLYTSDTCDHVHGNQDCTKNGRPDRDYQRWRWQPNCTTTPSRLVLPPFDPSLFLRVMAGKKILFVGDSLARNHMESLLCSLSSVEKPTPSDRYWEHMDLLNFTFPSYGFTIGGVWAPFLVTHEEDDTADGLAALYVDRPHPRWASVLRHYDVAIFSGAYWLYRRSIYYAGGRNMSIVDPADPNMPETVAAMKVVWKTVLKHVVEDSGFNGTAVMRTISVSHFDENSWDKGGTCNKTTPAVLVAAAAGEEQPKYEWQHDVVYKLQKEAFEEAAAEVERRRGRGESAPELRLMDVTYSTWLRPDGHPSSYRIQKTAETRNDCLHWCLPGVVDTWNQFLMADAHIMCPSHR